MFVLNMRELNKEILICKLIDSITEYKSFYLFLFLYLIILYNIKIYFIYFNIR